jgi:hypothetical protein
MGLIQAALVCALLVPALTSHAQDNTSYGTNALTSNTTGTDDSAFGFNALAYNTTGINNSAFGFNALYSNTIGIDNTAIGWYALGFNINGSYNTACGMNALFSNWSGYANTATGWEALAYNTTGALNTATGHIALDANTTGNDNTADGVAALFSNTTGGYNTALGYGALASNIAGGNNTAVGYQALNYSTGNNNVGIGNNAGNALTTGSNNIDISNSGIAGESGVIRIGVQGTQKSTYIAGIDGATATKGVIVFVNANGQLGTLKSSRRFKKDIRDMGAVSDKLMQLRPVTFRYNDLAEQGPHDLQYGLIAEEVAKVYPDLVQYDKAGKPYTIYYHLLTPMLLNELQKEHRQNSAMKNTVASLKMAVTAQNARITALNAEHRSEIAALNARLTAQTNALAALKQAQQQQLAAVERLTALVRNTQAGSPVRSAAYTRP